MQVVGMVDGGMRWAYFAMRHFETRDSLGQYEMMRLLSFIITQYSIFIYLCELRKINGR
jgi:hypothetical protein